MMVKSNGDTYLVTGATGLVGQAMVEAIVQAGDFVVAYVRHKAKAEQLLGNRTNVQIIEGSITQVPAYDGAVDYIIHTASPTSSEYFVEKPTETIEEILIGTQSILRYAKQKNVTSVVYLSSMEVYGQHTQETPITEDMQFYINPLAIRSNYPLAKRLSENLCAAYSQEFATPVKIVRLAQVIGEMLSPDDRRSIPSFIRSAADRHNIELATDGATKQTYISLSDAVSGIFAVMHDGQDGQAYNVANEDTYSSILDVATLVAEKVANNQIQVVANASGQDPTKYPPARKLRICSDKLKGIGWEPKMGLEESLVRLSKAG